MTTFDSPSTFSDLLSVPFTLAQAGVKPPSTDDLTANPAAGPAPAGSPATTTSTTGTATPTPAPAGGGGLGAGAMTMPLLIVLMLAVMIIPSMLASRKEKKKRAELMNSLGKGDKVITIGGQIGFVDQVRDQEVVLRIDENSNVRARFSKASIQTVLESASKVSTEASGAPNIEVKAKSDSPVPAR